MKLSVGTCTVPYRTVPYRTVLYRKTWMWICDTFMIQLRNKLFLKELLYIDFYVKQYMMEYGIDNVRGLIKS